MEPYGISLSWSWSKQLLKQCSWRLSWSWSWSWSWNWCPSLGKPSQACGNWGCLFWWQLHSEAQVEAQVQPQPPPQIQPQIPKELNHKLQPWIQGVGNYMEGVGNYMEGVGNYMRAWDLQGFLAHLCLIFNAILTGRGKLHGGRGELHGGRGE